MSSYNILIRNGFGNKVFETIIGLYIKDKRNVKLNGILKESKHKSDEIFDIFPKLKEHMKVIIYDKEKESEKDYYLLNCKGDYKSLYLEQINTKQDILINKNYSCYAHIFKMYNQFPKNLKDVYQINKNVISNQVINKCKGNYVAIHIRYGDKLISSNDKGRQHKFLLYSPEFYITTIKKFIKQKKKVYVLTDDNVIVNKFIIDKLHNKNVELLDLNWKDSFYVLSNCTELVLSMSTFSFLAALINNKLKKTYYVPRPYQISRFTYPEERAISQKWIKIYNKKYILNFDLKKIRTMLKYKENLDNAKNYVKKSNVKKSVKKSNAKKSIKKSVKNTKK